MQFCLNLAFCMPFCCLWGLLLTAKAGGIDIPFRTFFTKFMEKEGCLGGNYAEKREHFLDRLWS